MPAAIGAAGHDFKERNATMAMINDFVSRHFGTVQSDPQSLLFSLDIGLMNVGRCVADVRSVVLDLPELHGHRELEDTVAKLEALLAYLAQIGIMFDQLEQCELAAPRAPRQVAAACHCEQAAA